MGIVWQRTYHLYFGVKSRFKLHCTIVVSSAVRSTRIDQWSWHRADNLIVNTLYFVIFIFIPTIRMIKIWPQYYNIQSWIIKIVRFIGQSRRRRGSRSECRSRRRPGSNRRRYVNPIFDFKQSIIIMKEKWTNDSNR